MAGHPGGSTLRTLRVASEGEVLVQARGEQKRRQRYSDLSLGGMFIESLFPEEEGTELNLDLQVSGHRVRLPAQVVWSRTTSSSDDEPTGMGVAFETLTKAQKKLLYGQLAGGVQEGLETKSGTPPSRHSPPSGGLRGLLSRLRKK